MGTITKEILYWILNWLPIAVVAVVIVMVVFLVRNPEVRARLALVPATMGRYARKALRWLLPALGAATIIVIGVFWARHLEKSAANYPKEASAKTANPAQNPQPQNPPTINPPTQEAALRGEVEELRSQIATLNERIVMLTSGYMRQNAMAPSILNAQVGAIPAPGTIASRINNPLDIKYSPNVASLGGADSGIRAADGGTFASFVTPEDGIQAAVIMLTNPGFGYSNLTVDAALRKWSSNGYGAGITSVPGNIVVSQLTQDQLGQLVTDMAWRESGAAIGPHSIQAVSTSMPMPSGSQPSAVQAIAPAVFRISPCRLQINQLTCGGTIQWNGPDNSWLFLTDLKVGTAAGGLLQPSIGQFGDDTACFQLYQMPGSCRQKLHQQQVVALSFAVDNYTSRESATAYLDFESRQGKGTAKLLIRTE